MAINVKQIAGMNSTMYFKYTKVILKLYYQIIASVNKHILRSLDFAAHLICHSCVAWQNDIITLWFNGLVFCPGLSDRNAPVPLGPLITGIIAHGHDWCAHRENGSLGVVLWGNVPGHEAWCPVWCLVIINILKHLWHYWATNYGRDETVSVATYGIDVRSTACIIKQQTN